MCVCVCVCVCVLEQLVFAWRVSGCCTHSQKIAVYGELSVELDFVNRTRYHLIIRKKRRLLERMKRDNMLQSCLENDGNIFDNIKRQRKCKQTFPTTIDEHDDIPEYLAGKY